MTSQPKARSSAIALAVVILGSVALVGCSGPAATGAQQELNIVLHDNPPTNKALTAMTASFQKENPDIKVNLSFIPIADWAATRTARLSAKQVDITEGVTGPGATPLPDYVKGAPQSVWIKGVEAGNWVDLSGQKMLDNFIPTVIDALKVEGKSYQVPTSLNYVNGVFYNKELFAKVGASVPKTWSSFTTVMAKLKAANITPLSAGGKDNWPVGLIAIGAAQSLYPSLAEQQALDKGLWANTVKLNDAKNVQVLDRVNTIYQNIDPSFAGVDYSTAQGQFATGQTAMTVDGTWAASQFLATNPALKMGFFPLPVSDTSSDNKLGGKIDFTFVVPSATKNKVAALKWLDYFSQKKNYAAFATAGGIIPAQADVQLSPALASVKPYLNGSFDLAWDQVFHSNANAGSNVGPIGFNYGRLAPVGALNGAKIAQDAAQSDWAAGLAK